MTSPTVVYDSMFPTEGYPFWWARCEDCTEPFSVKFGPRLGVTASRAETEVSNWARDHRCTRQTVRPSAERRQLAHLDMVNDREAGDLS